VRRVTLLVPPTAPSAPEPDGVEAWRPRSDADLLAAQLRAVDAWHAMVNRPLPAVPGQSRESRLDEARRRDVADREREAMHEWAKSALTDEFPFGCGAVPRAVIAHRNEWLRSKVRSALVEQGVVVVASTDDGAQASAAIIMEQPDLVFVEDLLPTISGVELVRRTKLLAPDALVGVHALGQSGMPPLLDAGARAVFSRRIPPAEIVNELVACLHGMRATLTLV
jgi:CheY-like chemotaxis protein